MLCGNMLHIRASAHLPCLLAGMASQAVKDRLNRIGQGVLEASAGLSALAALMRGASHASPSSSSIKKSHVVCINPFHWPTYLKHLQQVPQFFEGLLPLAEEVMGDKDKAADSQATTASKKMGGKKGARGGLTREAIQAEVDRALEEVLGTRLAADEPLMSGEGALPQGVPCTSWLSGSEALNVTFALSC